MPDPSKVTHSPATPPINEAKERYFNSAKANSDRLQPGKCETDKTTGLRVIHPAANPHQVNPIHDEEHEAAATDEAAILVSKETTADEKRAVTEAANDVERNSAARIAPRKQQKQNDKA